MNNVILSGRLTRDPEIRYSTGDKQTAIARYTLACDRRFHRDGGQSADFISCVCFGKSAEFAEKYLHKGTKMIVRGRISTGSYTNKDGQKVYTTDVVVEDQEFAESKAVNENRSSGGALQTGGQAPAYGMAPMPSVPTPGSDGFINIPDGIDEELPFN